MNDELSDKQFFLTPPHPCSYLENRTARTLFLDPREIVNASDLWRLTHAGFRRSGSHLYRPYCDGCERMRAGREFQSRNSVGRGGFGAFGARTTDVAVDHARAVFSDRYYELYARYIDARHADGDMHPPNVDQFRSFLLSSWSNSAFLVARRSRATASASPLQTRSRRLVRDLYVLRSDI